LLGRADVGLAAGEAHVGVVVDGVDAVGEDVLKTGEVHGVGVAVEEEDVVGVYGADGGFDAGVEELEVGVFGIAGLVHGVVACYLFFCLLVFVELWGGFMLKPENKGR